MVTSVEGTTSFLGKTFFVLALSEVIILSNQDLHQTIKMFNTKVVELTIY